MVGNKCHCSDIDDARGLLGKAIDDLVSMACSGFQSWQQLILLEHASKGVKQQLADAQLKREIRHLEKESLEHKATDLLMQLTGAFGSCTSSLSLPDETS